MNEALFPIVELLSSIEKQNTNGWVYLPADEKWTPQSRSTALESEEVPPELENDPDAGIPALAKQNKLMQTLPVSVVQDIVRNVKKQKSDAFPSVLFEAFLYYYDHDAFIDLSERK